MDNMNNMMSNITSDSDYDVTFNFVRFIKFLRDYNIFAVAIAAILSDRINELTNTFVNNLIMPIINRDADKDGVKDIKNLEDTEFTIYGIKFGVGKFAMALLKFIIITYVLFLITKTVKYIGNRGNVPSAINKKIRL